MIWWFLLVPLLVMIVIFFRKPAYAMFGFIALVPFALITGVVAGSRQPVAIGGWIIANETSCSLFVLAGIYLTIGEWSHEREEERKFERNRLKQLAKAEEEVKARARSEKRQQATAAFKLGSFIGDSKDFGKEIRRRRALSSGALEGLTPEWCLFIDAISVVRTIALHSDELLLSDAAHLRIMAKAAHVPGMVEIRKPRLLEVLANAKTGDIESLKCLTELQSPEAQDLQGRLLKFAAEIGKSPVRSAGLQEANRIIRAAGTSGVVDPSDGTKKIDPRYALFEVSESCSDTELKAAYRTKAAAWHPDKLETVSLEVQQMASRHMSELNGAYESICAERRMR